MFVSVNEKQRNSCELCLMKIKMHGLTLETPSGISLALTNKPRDITPERWLAMLRHVINNPK